MTTRFFTRKNFLSKVTSTLTIAALLVQLVAPAITAYAVDEDPQLPAVVETTEIVPEVTPEVLTTTDETTAPVEDVAEAQPAVEEARVAVEGEATISATTIVCDTEADLPDWGATNQAVDETTATVYVTEHPNCKKVSGWNYQWSQTEANMGDNAPSGGPEWTTFGPTGVDGIATIAIPAETNVVIRQIGKHHFIDFSGQNFDKLYSAELICGAPESNHLFNNRESLGSVTSGTTYHCIAFNTPVPVVEEVPTATLVATKIVCDLESDLPDLAATNTAITATTATDFLATHPGCRAQAGWNFQWSHKSVGSPGDNKQMGGEGWNLVGPTGVNGTVTMPIPVADDITVREERRGGYIGFSGIDNHHASVSAEMVCGTPPEGAIHRYDNREPLGALTEGGIVYCVAFNPVLPNPETATMCEANVNLIKNGGFEAPIVANGDYDIVPSGTTGLEWLVEWVSGSLPAPAGLEIQHAVAGTSFGGSLQHAELDGDAPVAIYQNIPTVIGKEYKLDYHYSARPNVVDNTIEIKINGTVAATLSQNGTGNADTVWNTGTLTFVATSTTTKVEFKDTSNPDTLGGYIDSISMTCLGNPQTPPVDQTPGVSKTGSKVSGSYATRTLGEVLGASTEAEVDAALAMCEEYIHSFIKFGQKNSAGDVIRLQTFLNQYLGTKLIPSGTYDKATFDAVKKFQVETKAEVLLPWKDTPGGINEGGTGYVYKTTKRMINMIKCPALNIAMPELK